VAQAAWRKKHPRGNEKTAYIISIKNKQHRNDINAKQNIVRNGHRI